MKIFFLIALVCSLLSAAEPFRIQVKTDNPGTSTSTQFTLPLFPSETYNFTINWGDGTAAQNIITATSPTHNYDSAGAYTISITENTLTGGFPRIYFNYDGDKLKLVRLVQWGDVHWSSFGSAFTGCENLVITATDHAAARTGTVTDFSYAWYGCSSLTSFPLINTVAGTDFSYAWALCRGLTSFPLINTATATNFSAAWWGCGSLTSFPLINTAAATDFFAAWSGCTNLTSFPFITTAAATNFSGAWSGCSRLTSFPLITTAAGTDFSSAWSGCSGLTSFPLITTAAGTNFYGAWYGCSGLTSFPLITTAAGTNFSRAWYDCSGLTSFPLITTASGTDFSGAWSGCSGLTSFPLITTAAGTNLSDAWHGCSGLTSFPLIDTAAGTDFSYAWHGCSGLTSFPLISTANGTYFSSTWEDCSSLREFPVLNLSNMSLGGNCFAGVTLPTATYSALLTDLAARGIWAHVTFSGGNSRYVSSAAEARNTLTSFLSWTITDGGMAALNITSPSAASVLLNAPFTYTITASDNPTSFGASGVPSPLSHTNGVISGSAPSAIGTYRVTISATNGEGTESAPLTLYVNGAGAPAITSATTAGGIRGQAFTTYQITATNSPTSWAAIGLPPGLSCSSTGAITGTPTVAGTTQVSVRATNAAGTGVATLTVVIPKQVQSLTFTSPGAQSYGSVLTLGASSTSGLAVGYQVLSGSSTVSGNQLTIRDSSGTVVVEASQAGNATYAAATPVQVSFAASPATLTVQADSKVMAQGASVPALTWQLSGLKLADTASVLSGIPALSTTATNSSAPGVYPISVSVSGVTAPNYTVVAGNSTLTVSASGSGGSGGGGGGGGGGCGVGSVSAMLLAMLACLGFRRRSYGRQ